MRLLPFRLGRVCRRLARAPLFTSVAIVTLALGIGANTAIFSVVRGVLLKPLPFDDADRLVGVWLTAPGLGFPKMNQSPASYFTFREGTQVFENFGLWDNTSVSVTGTGEPERVQALLVTDGTLPALRVPAQVGRRFTLDDDSPRTPERVMLTDAFWTRKFGRDPSVVGRLLTVDGKPREIIGVLPASFRFLNYDPQLVLPLRFNRAEVMVGNFSYQGVARLKPRATIEQANAEIARLLPTMVDKFPLPSGFTRQ
ncbi:MAG TPA: ABC transporter permease, partial [Gemmatimonadaceae bacterium]